MRLSYAAHFMLAISLGVSASVQNAVAADHYTVTFNYDLSRVSVNACFYGEAPAWLQVNRDVSPAIESLIIDDRTHDPDIRRSRLSLPKLTDNSCLRYQVNIDHLLSRNQRRLAIQMGNTRLLAGNTWFWRGPRQREVRLAIRLPEGQAISVPWQPDQSIVSNKPNVHHFIADHSSGSWSSLTAVGPFHRRNIPVQGTELQLAIVGVDQPDTLDKLSNWIEESAGSVGAVHGQFPQPTPQVLVVDIGRQREPVPWAQVQRGGGVAAHFYVDASRSEAAFRDDWTATHEFSHMLLPYVSSNDRWLSEGLASYYQNILRARDGRLSEEAAWRKLDAGFRRGMRDDTHGDMSLAEVSRRMRSEGAYMRVYWSGAAVMLLADVRLREQSDGRQSLDTALQGLKDCCFANGQSWRAWDLFQRLDQLTNTRIFSDLYREYARNDHFPDLQPTYEALGVEADSRWIGLQNNARLANIRSNITRG